MLTNWDIITLVNTIRNKDLEGEDMRTDEFQSLLNTQSQLMFAEKLGIPNLYQIGSAIERKGAEVSRKISQELKPFLVTETVGTSGGQVDVSAKGIGYLLAVEPTTISGRGFDELDPSEYADRVGDAVVAPTESDPALTWNDGDTFLVYPSTIIQVVLKYYKYPTDAVIVTTQNPTTLRLEYYAAGSTELEWHDQQKVELAYRVLRDLGVNMERQDVVQYANQIVSNE